MDELNAEIRFRKTIDTNLEIAPLSEIDAQTLIDAVPVRTPPHRPNQRHYPGMFWFSTTQRTVTYESLMERDRLWLADFDPDVRAASTQPFHISSTEGTVPRQHVPDMFFQHADGSHTLVDVKPREFLDKPRVREQFAWTGELCKRKGWKYEVWAGAHATVLRNVRYAALGRRALQLHPELVRTVATHGKPGMTLGRAIEAASAEADTNNVRVVSLALLWTHRWRIDLTAPLSDSSVLLSEEERPWMKSLT